MKVMFMFNNKFIITLLVLCKVNDPIVNYLIIIKKDGINKNYY